MSRSQAAPRSVALALLAFAGAGWSAQILAAGAGGAEDLSAYHQFAADARGSVLMNMARRIYRAAAEAAEVFPVDPAGATGRPAGPRDEPPPPEWPERPAGLVLCLRVMGKIRACEGELPASHQDLGAAVSVLAERLPLSRSRGRPKAMTAAERDAASLEAVFALPRPLAAGEVTRAGRAAPPARIDPASAGMHVTGSRGEVFLLPGEAVTVKRARRAARKAGATPRAGGEAEIEWFVAVPIGTVPLAAP